MRIGIFGGSFDPVHNDHVEICKKFKEEVSLDKVIVVPTKLSPFKNVHLATGENRKIMLELAFRGCKDVEISDFELNADGVSYTYLTVEKIKKDYPLDEIFLLIGLDSLANFIKWKNSLQILANCTLVVAGREGYDAKAVLEDFEKVTFKRPLYFEYDGKISSTYVREQLYLGLQPLDFVNSEVCKYIREQGLYSAKDIYPFVKSKLSEKRLLHTAGVVATAVSYAKKLGENVDNARIAGLLHDIAKYEKQEDYPECELPSGVPNSVKHQYLGAYIAEKVLGIKNEEVLNAIRFHTTGRPNMTILEKIVFVADLLEPSRDYEEVEYLRDLVSLDFETGFRKCLERLVVYLKKGGQEIFNLTLKANEYYNEKK